MQYSRGSPRSLLPYEGVTKDTLRQRWLEERPRRQIAFGGCEVLPFHKGNERFGYFSNWFIHEPIEFEVPSWCCLEGLPAIVPCTFFEKAIMLCKAATMRDRETYTYILGAKFPKDAKDLGQGVQGFDQELWDEVVCSVAFEICMQKFGKSQELSEHLMATGNKLLAEAAPRDISWGVGLKATHPSVQIPEEWLGTNILGWGLMEVRECLTSGRLRLADGMHDLTACRAYAHQITSESAEDNPSYIAGSAIAADDANPSGVDLLQKVIGGLMNVPLDTKVLKLRDETIRKRCEEDCYEDVTAVLTRLGYSLDESLWICRLELEEADTRHMLQGAHRRLMEVAWLNGGKAEQPVVT